MGDSLWTVARFTGSISNHNLTQGSAFGSTLGFMLAPAPRADAPSVNIFKLLLENIIDHAENDLSRRPFGEEWRSIKETAGTLNKRSPKQKQELIERIKTFNNGLRVKLEELQSKAADNRISGRSIVSARNQS